MPLHRFVPTFEQQVEMLKEFGVDIERVDLVKARETYENKIKEGDERIKSYEYPSHNLVFVVQDFSSIGIGVWGAMATVTDRDKPWSSMYNHYLQNTSQWIFAGRFNLEQTKEETRFWFNGG